MINYEWDIETVDEHGDIIDHHHADKLKEYPKDYTKSGGDLVLVRDDNYGRSWAYVQRGFLPEYFTNAFGGNTAKVPMRFHKELNSI